MQYMLKVASGLLLPAIAWAAVAQATPVMLSPVIMRQAATLAPLPSYPSGSISMGHKGVVSVDLVVNASGVPESVVVLQAPDTEIADSVTKTLKTWRFKSFVTDRGPNAIRSRLIFYFDLDGAGPHVKDAMRSSF